MLIVLERWFKAYGENAFQALRLEIAEDNNIKIYMKVGLEGVHTMTEIEIIS